MTNNLVKSCSIYLLQDDSMLINGQFFEPSGPGFLGSDVCVRISSTLVDDVLGDIVISVLEKTTIKHGADWDEEYYKKNLLSFAGEKTYKSLYKKSKHIAIQERDNFLAILPSKLVDKNGCYFAFLGKEIITPKNDIKEIVSDITKAFAMCS